MATVKRHKSPGRSGGRPVGRRFWFAPGDGNKNPAESESIRTKVLDVPSNELQQDSWKWALDRMDASNTVMWLVVPIDQTDEQRDLGVARATIWRTARRNKMEVTSEYIAPNLYVALAS